MGSKGDIDIKNPKFPVRLTEAWHAQAAFLVPFEFFEAWRRRFPEELVKNRFDEFLPQTYGPGLIDGQVQITFFFVNHLASNLGAYFHTGAIVRAVPKGLREVSPGYYIGLEVVDEPFSWIAGYRIWGYAKMLGKVEVKGSVREGDEKIQVSLALPKKQPDREKENETYTFDKKTCTERVFTMTISKPEGAVLPYERDVYSHTLFNPGGQGQKRPCETRFRRTSLGEFVQPWSGGVEIQFHQESLYGNWLGRLETENYPRPEVRWAPFMSGFWDRAAVLPRKSC